MTRKSIADACENRRVPPHLTDGIVRYLRDGVAPGGFLMAALRNDLVSAVSRADAESLAGLRHLVSFIFNDMPSDAWGSPEAVNDWLAERETDDAARRDMEESRG